MSASLSFGYSQQNNQLAHLISDKNEVGQPYN